MWAVTSLTSSPMEALRSTTGSATSGIDTPVVPGSVNGDEPVVPVVVTSHS